MVVFKVQDICFLLNMPTLQKGPTGPTSPQGDALSRSYHTPRRLSVSYIIYVLRHNLASFYVSSVFARGSTVRFQPSQTQRARVIPAPSLPSAQGSAARASEPRVLRRRDPPGLPTSKREAGEFRARPGANGTSTTCASSWASAGASDGRRWHFKAL